MHREPELDALDQQGQVGELAGRAMRFMLGERFFPVGPMAVQVRPDARIAEQRGRGGVHTDQTPDAGQSQSRADVDGVPGDMQLTQHPLQNREL